MQQQPEFGFEQLVTELLRGLANAVADRAGETDAQRFARHQTAVFSAMAFLPRDALEVMLAGQAVMFDHLLQDATRDVLRGQPEPIKCRIRSQIVALGRLFLKHLEELRELQSRPVEKIARSPDVQGKPLGEAGRSPDATSIAPAPESPSGGFGPEPEPDATAPNGTGAPAAAHGFQNRQMRRALQFRKPAAQAPAAVSARKLAGAPAAASVPGMTGS